MLTINNHEILFDDLAVIKFLRGANHSINTPTMNINDCTNNIHLPNGTENVSPDSDCSGYKSIEDDEEFSAAKIA